MLGNTWQSLTLSYNYQEKHEWWPQLKTSMTFCMKPKINFGKQHGRYKWVVSPKVKTMFPHIGTFTFETIVE